MIANNVLFEPKTVKKLLLIIKKYINLIILLKSEKKTDEKRPIVVADFKNLKIAA